LIVVEALQNCLSSGCVLGWFFGLGCGLGFVCLLLTRLCWVVERVYATCC